MSPQMRRWFWIIVLAQSAFLLTWAGYHESIRRHSPVIRLKTAPVDPRDLLRGDYMILGYEIGRIKPPGEPDAQRGKSVWVVLEQHGEYHEAVARSLEKPDLRAGQIAVVATDTWSGLEFGIERFFVPEGKGTPKFDRLDVEASVSPSHRLYIKRLLVDGRPYP